MRIGIYQLNGLNENYYIDYLKTGFIKNGHEVYVLDEPFYRNNLETIKNYKIEFLVFGGFAFMNLLSHQGWNTEFLPVKANIPYVVMWYDNPERYLYHLQFLKKTNYKFICCDSQIAEEMRELGFKNTYSLPCCFDPEIQKPLPSKGIRYPSLVFPGTVFEVESLLEKRANFNFAEISVLNTFQKQRANFPGIYAHYFSYLTKYMSPFDSRFGEICFPMIMEQKHALRMEMLYKLREYPLDIFGVGNFNPAKYPGLHNVTAHGYLNQHTQLPEFYSNSKIVLSIELLPASVHQRVFEVMGCGGFVLCENKFDMYKCFSSEVCDALIWKNLGELEEKIKYYLANEPERKRISDLARQEVLEKHTNIIRIEQILEIMKRR